MLGTLRQGQRFDEIWHGQLRYIAVVFGVVCPRKDGGAQGCGVVCNGMMMQGQR